MASETRYPLKSDRAILHDKAYLRDRYGFDECKILGTGCFGTVYLGRDHWENRPVAIKKQLRLPWNAAEHNVQMQLHHPHILRAHDQARGRRHQYLVTELGSPIDPRTVTLAQAQTYMHNLLDSLAYTHDMGVAHRDIKVGNILACDGTLRVIDYGKAGFNMSRTMHRICMRADIARACGVFAKLLAHSAPHAAEAFKAWYKGQPHLSRACVRQHPLLCPASGAVAPTTQRLTRALWPLRKAVYTGAMIFPVNFRPTYVLPCTVHAGCASVQEPAPLTTLLDEPPPTKLCSAWVTKRFSQARASAQQADKSRYLRMFNRHVAPLLTSELAALERLAMQTCRLNMRGDEHFIFNVKTDAKGFKSQAYASEYVFYRAICTQDGCRALALTPISAHPQNNSILCLAGLAYTPDGMRHRREGRGFRTLADNPIGQTAYAQARYALQEVLRTLLLRQGDITIVGHSLGGTVAMLMLAELPAAVQARVKLITFGAPKVPASVAANIVVGDLRDAHGHSRSIRAWVHGDRFANFGSSVPHGTLTLEISSAKGGIQGHRITLLGDAQIDAAPIAVAWGAAMPRGKALQKGFMQGGYKLVSCWAPA